MQKKEPNWDVTVVVVSIVDLIHLNGSIVETKEKRQKERERESEIEIEKYCYKIHNY